jgi:uncharacterized protein YjbI with pentapeptide repeats
MVIDGCTIVSNPTPTHFTNCPGQDLAGGNLSGLDLSYANFGGARFADCSQGSVGSLPTCVAATLSDANLTDAILTNIVPAYAFLTHCNIPPGPCSASGSASFNSANLSGATLSNAEYGSVDFSNANLAGANLTGADFDTGATNLGPFSVGATLTGANFTNTILVPSNQTVTATSQAGAVATWSTPTGLPGATPGRCTPASGSTFPLFSSTVNCQVLDANNHVATGTFQVNVTPTTQYFTRVGIPSDGAVLAGNALLDALAGDGPGVTKVVFELSGGALSNHVIATASPTYYGWLAQWNTTAVPNGTYNLQSVATDTVAESTTSASISVTVANAPPSTAVLIPSGGATQSGTAALLDARASANVTSVSFELSGNGLSDQVIATATPTYYGWLAQWNTKSVANGTYSLQSVAAYAGGVSGPSPPITIIVSN